MIRYSVLIILSLSIFGCKTSPSSNGRIIIEQGVASWYGPNFHGKPTANGERFDMHDFTAAHRTLPFNSIVEVENLQNHKTVEVRINDRGPFAKDRIIDLSKRAAEEIEMIGPGTAKVRLTLLKSSGRQLPSDIKSQSFTVQLASFKTQKAAESQSAQIPGSWIQKVDVNQETVYRVCFGKYDSPNEASDTLLELDQKGFKGFVKQVEN